MEQYLQLIFLLAFVKFGLKSSLVRKACMIPVYGIVAGAFVWAVYPLVIGLRGDSFTAILADRGMVSDCALLITVESVLGIMTSVLLLDNYFAPREKRKRSLFVLKVIPGVLFFVGVVYFELLFFKLLVGMPFGRAAALYGGTIFAAVTAGGFGLRWLLPGESMKLDAKILLDLAILGVAIFVNAAISDYSVSHSVGVVEWLPTAVAAAVIAVGAAAGFACYRRRDSLRRAAAAVRRRLVGRATKQ